MGFKNFLIKLNLLGYTKNQQPYQLIKNNVMKWNSKMMKPKKRRMDRIITFLETFCLLFEIVIQNVSDHFGANLVETQKPCTTLRVVSLFCIAFFRYSKNHLESISN